MPTLKAVLLGNSSKSHRTPIFWTPYYTGYVNPLRIMAILISPGCRRAAHGIFDQLNWKMELSGKEETIFT